MSCYPIKLPAQPAHASIGRRAHWESAHRKIRKVYTEKVYSGEVYTGKVHVEKCTMKIPLARDELLLGRAVEGKGQVG